jgi:hypothetical protein
MQIKRTWRVSIFAQGIHRPPKACDTGITGKIGKIVRIRLSGKVPHTFRSLVKLPARRQKAGQHVQFGLAKSSSTFGVTR